VLKSLRLTILLSTHFCIFAFSAQTTTPRVQKQCKSLLSINEKIVDHVAVTNWIKKNLEEQHFTYETLAFELYNNGLKIPVNKVWRSINQPPKRVDLGYIFALEKIFGNSFTDHSPFNESKLNKYTIQENLEFFYNKKGIVIEDLIFHLREEFGYKATLNLIWRHINEPPAKENNSLKIHLNSLRELKYPDEF